MTSPIKLPTAASRRQRRRFAIGVITVGVSIAALFTFLTVRTITKPGAKATLGDETFRVGEAAPLARRVVRDDYPLLFQDLRDSSIDLFVDHDRTKPAGAGWRAFEAHAPNAPRTCQLRFDRYERRFIDPCDGARYATDGTGLRTFRTVVRNGIVIVDLRRPAATTTTLDKSGS